MLCKSECPTFWRKLETDLNESFTITCCGIYDIASAPWSTLQEAYVYHCRYCSYAKKKTFPESQIYSDQK